MAEFYAFRIMNGQTTFDKVPKSIKEQVKEILMQSGCANLIAE